MIEQTYPIAEKLIANALQLAQQLHHELTQEASALKKMQQAERIGTIADSKKQLVAQLDQLNAQITQILAIEKLPNTPDSVKDYFKSAETAGLPTAESANNWTQLMRVCSECRRQNEENGASIDVLSRHAQRSLNIIKGKPESANTYDADGSTHSERHTSPLISV
ncbi:MAG: flagella synthesis protein FlgN [Methylobacter sp.]